MWLAYDEKGVDGKKGVPMYNRNGRSSLGPLLMATAPKEFAQGKAGFAGALKWVYRTRRRVRGMDRSILKVSLNRP